MRVSLQSAICEFVLDETEYLSASGTQPSLDAELRLPRGKNNNGPGVGRFQSNPSISTNIHVITCKVMFDFSES